MVILEHMIYVLPYFALLFFAALSSSFFPKWTRLLALLTNNLSLLYEACVGLLQATGIKASHHALYAVTGTFGNPGPYGGFIAVTSCIALAHIIQNHHRISRQWIAIYRKDKNRTVLFSVVLLYLSLSAIIAGLIVLPLSMSRSGWIAFGGGTVMAVTPILRNKKWFTKAFRLKTYLALISILICFWFIKRDSALGRLHIWRIESIAITENPWTGVGFGKEMGAYGLAQEHFFAKRERSAATMQVAGCPEYAFNEYLGIGMQGGLPALILAVFIVMYAIVRLHRSFKEAACGLLAYALFAFSSYPLSIPLLRAILFILLGLALASSRRKLRNVYSLCSALTCVATFIMIPKLYVRHEAVQHWQDISSCSFQYDKQAEHLTPLYPYLKDNYLFLYDLGYALHKQGRYSESSRYLSEGLTHSSDPMFLNILGKNCEACGDDAGAESFYRRSILRVPCRLYPRLLLIRLYRRMGRTTDALIQANKALSLPINESNIGMKELQKEIAIECHSIQLERHISGPGQ